MCLNYKNTEKTKLQNQQLNDSVIKKFGMLTNGLMIVDRSKVKSTESKRCCYMKLSDDEILSYIRKAASQLKRKPKMREVEVSRAAIYRFGSWNEALIKAGLKINKRGNLSNNELLYILEERITSLGRIPLTKEFEYYGKIIERFGSWENALGLIGISFNRYKTKEQYIKELQDFSKRIGKVPTKVDCQRERFPIITYQRNFGTWNKALIAAGLEPNKGGSIYTKEQLVQLIQKKYNELESVPTLIQMEVSLSVFKKHFGSWNKALETAGFKPYTQNKGRVYTEQELISIIIEKEIELGRKPKLQDMNINFNIFKRHFGSWKNALKAAVKKKDT